MKNVQHTPLIVRSKIILPPLHVKLGLMKNIVKGMNQDVEGYKNLRGKFSQLSDAKIKEGIFVGLPIRELLKDQKFKQILDDKEKAAWAFLKVLFTD